jgi:hypothetical protein
MTTRLKGTRKMERPLRMKKSATISREKKEMEIITSFSAGKIRSEGCG